MRELVYGNLLASHCILALLAMQLTQRAWRRMRLCMVFLNSKKTKHNLTYNNFILDKVH